MKIRFIEPGNTPYKASVRNHYVYDKYIRTPAIGLITLATIVKQYHTDTLVYSEAISTIIWDDILDADIVFIGAFTFNVNRGYELADSIMQNSNAKVIMGGMHPTLNLEEACEHCDYVILGEADETVMQIIEAVENDNFPSFQGVAYKENDTVISTGMSPLPIDINTVPDRNLVYNYKNMVKYNTIWPQVHASRGCPHNCDYCAVIKHFGRTIRKRTPENILEDIRRSIDFHDNGTHRLSKMLWFTDDNFFSDREWAKSVLYAIIDSGIKYNFTIQARYEVGFDDEILFLLKQAGFVEIAMGIEFLEDEAFEQYHKISSYDEIVESVENIQKHGLRVRGLFIMGADNHTEGAGKRLSDFVIKNEITGVLIQAMYFIPGTPAYENKKDKLLHRDWSKYKGHAVHHPEKISPYGLQKEIITASRRIYSKKRLLHALFKRKGLDRILFIGEYFWQKDTRRKLKDELVNLP